MSFNFCGTTTNACKVFNDIVLSGFKVNPEAFAAAKNYAIEQLTPIENSVIQELENTVYLLVFMILILILIPLIVLVLFIGTYFNISRMQLLIILLIILIFIGGLGYYTATSILTELRTEVNNRFEGFFNDLDKNETAILLENASLAYNEALA